MRMAEAKGYWDSYEDADVEESGGGRGGIIAQVTVDTGFKVYTGAVPQPETFFSADARDKASRIDGPNLAFSMAMIVCRVTPTAAARDA